MPKKLNVPLGVTMAKLAIDETANDTRKLLEHKKQVKALFPTKPKTEGEWSAC